jgi:two-component system, sensor histidine kinase PdtaS
MKNTFLIILFSLSGVVGHPQNNSGPENPIGQSPKDFAANIISSIGKAKTIGENDTARAEKIFIEAIASSKKYKNNYLAGKAYYEMGEMFFNHKNHNRSFGAFMNARNQFSMVDAEKEVAYTLFGLGRQQYFRGNYKVAASHLNFAMRAARKLNLKALESEALEYLGILYHVMPGTEFQSASTLKKALFLKVKLNDKKGMLRMMEKLGDVYYQQNNFDSTMRYLNQSINLATELNLYHDADLSKLNRVGVYIRQHRMNVAKRDLNYIIKHTADTGDTNIMIRYFIQKGNYFTSGSFFSEGMDYYNKAMKVAGRIGMPELYSLVYKNMADAYSDKGMYKEAWQFQQKYNNQIVGFYAENIPVIKELELNINSNLTKDKIDWLSAENKLNEIKLENEKRIGRILLAGTITFLLLATVIFYLYQKQKSKNHIIKKQSDELITLMKEVDHRVKNNLQIISSLLDMQSLIIKDKHAAMAVKEGRNRVQSMALIHQNLYNEGNSNGIAINIYINNLAQSLFHSYNIHQGQIELKMEIENLRLDVDTVIPIGLVLNELISNSLKYAFKSNAEGSISITLQRHNEVLFLKVKDNGKGFPVTLDTARSSSFGMRMIKAFAQKLKADLDIYNDDGACVTMRIRKYKIAA